MAVMVAGSLVESLGQCWQYKTLSLLLTKHSQHWEASTAQLVQTDKMVPSWKDLAGIYLY